VEKEKKLPFTGLLKKDNFSYFKNTSPGDSKSCTILNYYEIDLFVYTCSANSIKIIKKR